MIVPHNIVEHDNFNDLLCKNSVRMQLHQMLSAPSDFFSYLELTAFPLAHFNPCGSQAQKVHSPRPFQEKRISEVVRISSIIIFHLSKLWKAKVFIFVVQYFWWGCRGKLKLITVGSEWKGQAISGRAHCATKRNHESYNPHAQLWHWSDSMLLYDFAERTECDCAGFL